MQELDNKKLELMDQAVIYLIQFLCDYFGSGWWTNEQLCSNNMQLKNWHQWEILSCQEE